MTDTAQKILELFGQHEKVKPGMVLTLSELSRKTREWEPRNVAGIDRAVQELHDEGYVIITAPHGLELTERGFSYLFGES